MKDIYSCSFVILNDKVVYTSHTQLLFVLHSYHFQVIKNVKGLLHITTLIVGINTTILNIKSD